MDRLEGERCERGVGTDSDPADKHLGETTEWGTN